ncbi:MAG: DUF4115 domain-containing protein [Candidatus Omnitrophica bacterium]|nr:DUF4115 domain-containing protein [Candidatus Omnitrophota bacterium]
MPTPKEIGNIFKEARKKKGLSVLEAAHKSRILEEVVRDIETGVFDRLGKPYVKGFLGKYAKFLGLDADDIIDQYSSISSRIPSKELDFGQDPKEKKVDVLPGYRKKKVQAAIALSFSALVVVFVMYLIGSARSRSATNGGRRIESGTAAERRSLSVKPSERTAVTRDGNYELTLNATGEVWVQVKRGENTVYAGIMQRGDAKTFSDDGPLTVLTGKGEELEFAFNGTDLGVIAEGVVKDIRVSSDGIKVGSRWAVRGK